MYPWLSFAWLLGSLTVRVSIVLIRLGLKFHSGRDHTETAKECVGFGLKTNPKGPSTQI